MVLFEGWGQWQPAKDVIHIVTDFVIQVVFLVLSKSEHYQNSAVCALMSLKRDSHCLVQKIVKGQSCFSLTSSFTLHHLCEEGEGVKDGGFDILWECGRLGVKVQLHHSMDPHLVYRGCPVR